MHLVSSGADIPVQIYKSLTCRLTLGLFFVTMFLSMWISNTAATAMMLPIVETVLLELEAVSYTRVYCTVQRRTSLTSARLSSCFQQGLGDMFVSEENAEDNTEP